MSWTLLEVLSSTFGFANLCGIKRRALCFEYLEDWEKAFVRFDRMG